MIVRTSGSCSRIFSVRRFNAVRSAIVGAAPQTIADDTGQERLAQDRGAEDAADQDRHHRDHDELAGTDADAGRLELGVQAIAEAARLGEPLAEVGDAVGDPAGRPIDAVPARRAAWCR